MAEKTIAFPQTRIRRLPGLGLKAELAVLAGLVLLGGAIAAHLVITRTYSPEGAVRQYLAALDRGDADGAWAASIVNSSGVKADATLLNLAGLKASLGLGKPTAHSDLTVTGARSSGADELVDVAYNAGGAGHRATYRVRPDPTHKHLGLYPSWQVVVTPALVSIALPKAGGAFSVDGQAVDVAAGDAVQLAVFPGHHQLAMAASALFNAAQAEVAAEQAAPAVAKISLRLSLTDAAKQGAVPSVKQAFAACAAATVLGPSGCPFGVIDNLDGPAHWSLLNDPSADLIVALDDRANILAKGHYLTAITYNGIYPSRPHHKLVGGAFQAPLTWDGQKLSVQSLSAGQGVPALQRPGVDDATVLQAVSDAFKRCAAIKALADVDCRQSAFGVGKISNVAWELQADPGTGASVNWDGDHGYFQVTGSFAMAVTFDQDNPYLPTMHESATSTGQYKADLFWNGQKAQFVTFE